MVSGLKIFVKPNRLLLFTFGKRKHKGWSWTLSSYEYDGKRENGFKHTYTFEYRKGNDTMVRNVASMHNYKNKEIDELAIRLLDRLIVHNFVRV